MGPYRELNVEPELACPRCRQRLPALDVAACRRGCGTWITAFAASEILTSEECRPDRVTRWWKKREPCPTCGDQMLLRGAGDGRFQGCDGHGFWLDADAIAHTGLGRGVDQTRLDRKRDDEARLAADREARHAAERRRDQEKHDKEIREANVAKRIAEGALELPATPNVLDTVVHALSQPGYLERRIQALEAHNHELEQRIAALELALRRRR